MTKSKKTATIPFEQEFPGITHFTQDNGSLIQVFRFRRNKKVVEDDFQLPLNKVLKGSISYRRDPAIKNGKYIEGVIRLYNKARKIYSTSLLETRYSRVTVSRSRITVSLSFPLCEEAERLKARLQNFGNIIIDESDEIAAMLNQEGLQKVQEAWNTIDQLNESKDEEEI